MTKQPFINNTSTSGNELEPGILEKTRAKTQRPSMYGVVLLNDDYTPMEFVII